MNEGKARGCHVYTFTIAIISMDVHSSLHYCLLPSIHKNGRLLRTPVELKQLANYYFAFLPPFSFSFSNTAKNSDAILRMARPMSLGKILTQTIMAPNEPNTYVTA